MDAEEVRNPQIATAPIPPGYRHIATHGPNIVAGLATNIPAKPSPKQKSGQESDHHCSHKI